MTLGQTGDCPNRGNLLVVTSRATVGAGWCPWCGVVVAGNGVPAGWTRRVPGVPVDADSLLAVRTYPHP